MSSDEIRTRLQGWLNQRTDSWRGRKALDAELRPGASVPGSFFFDSGESVAVAREITQRLPDEAASIVDAARRIQNLRFDVLGYTDLSFGQPAPDWHLDAVHGIRAPYTVWFRIPFLNFNEVGDHKIIWELSRHQFLGLLARAWLFTGDSSCLESLERLWRDWQKNNPYPFGINWASTLEVAFRSLSWIWVDHLIETAGPSVDGFRAELQRAIGENAVYIERYLSTYFAPNTHLLGEALALFSIGVLYPQFEPASRWRDRGWQVVLEQSVRQVRPDGFHFEQSIYYHVYALDMFLWARILAERNGIAVPGEFDDVIVRMSEGLATLASGGLVPRFGDDDGGRLFDGRRNQTHHMLDPLATASAVYKRGDWKAVAGDLREESIWLLGVDRIRTFGSLKAHVRRNNVSAFDESGYYVMHSGSGAAIIDAGPHGWRNGGHGHADALSLQLIANQQTWLTDPGTYSYVYEGGLRDQFRGTRAHNTLEVDKKSQAEPVHPFAWGAAPRVSVVKWHVSSDTTILHASHEGYHRLHEPVTHERWVIAMKEGEWMVRDVATGKGSHQLDVRWHLAPGCTPSQENRGYAFSTDTGAVRLAYPDDSCWNTSLETGQWSPAYGVQVPCPVLRFSYQGSLPAECSIVITLDQAEAVLGRVSPTRTNAAAVYVWRKGPTERVIAFGTPNRMWSAGPLKSNAELLILECESDGLTSMLCYGGSEVEIDGVHLNSSAGEGDVFEWQMPDRTEPLVPPASVRALLLALHCLEDPCPGEAASAPACRQNNL